MIRLDTPLLCFVTDRNRCLKRDLEEVVDRAVTHGVRMVQLREKDLSAHDLYELGLLLKNVIDDRATLI
ncbi:MAG: thiamine phosphate synthase, partial [Chloroflexi bacterium]|nr:thiamine phosphate synthase [Chloroflexota bacterium]